MAELLTSAAMKPAVPLLLAAWILQIQINAVAASSPNIQVYFSPKGGCTEAVVDLREFKAQNATVKRQRTLQVGHFEMHVTNRDAGDDWLEIFAGVHRQFTAEVDGDCSHVALPAACLLENAPSRLFS